MIIETQPFKCNIYDKKQKIIIYGASVYGELAYKGLQTIGLNPDFFCDQSKEIKLYCNVNVISPYELVQKYKKANIIIASADFFFEIKDMLENMGCSNLYDMRYLLEQNINVEYLSNRAREMYANRQHYINIANNQRKNKILFNRIQYVVTEKCTLRCKDCSHLIPYYENPENIDVKKYKKSFDLLLKQIDYLAELRILGGEPFVSPDLSKLILDYQDNLKIEQISVYTNGTVIPNDDVLEILKGEKVRVHISDYLINKDKIEKLTKLFEEYEIKYFVRKYDAWQESGGVDYRNYTEKQLKDKFSNCFERNGYTFLKGRLYRCPRVAHAINLHAIPDNKTDYIDLENWNDSEEQLKNSICFLQKKTWLNGCNYCEGPDNHCQSIPAAIQCKKNIPYNRLGE